MTAPSSDAIAILRIEIEYIEPLIWRRIAVPTSINLKALHKIIQAAMGWLDYHLWEFTADERRYGILIPDDPDWNGRISNAASTKLSALLTAGVVEFGYMYDFGDDWEHRIIVEATKPAVAGESYPRFLGGERRCPPEDCGGPAGYFEFIESIASKRSKKAKEAIEWYGGPYDPENIDEQKIATAFERLATPRRSDQSKAAKK
jgi:Plasmid pRiA4b ORF-3-like protein